MEDHRPTNRDEVPTVRNNMIPQAAGTYNSAFFQTNPRPELRINEGGPVGTLNIRLNVGYIRNFFNAFSPTEKEVFLGLYHEYMEVQRGMGQVDRPPSNAVALGDLTSLSETENFLVQFSSDQYFIRSISPFCQSARRIILHFERTEMEYEKPYVRDWLWEQRHLELFCLKYLCVDAVRRGDDSHLALFISDSQVFAEDAVFSRYNMLKESLKVLNEARVTGRAQAAPRFNTDVNKQLVEEKEVLRMEASKIDVLQKAFFEDRARRDREEAQRDAQIRREQASILSEINELRQQVTQGQNQVQVPGCSLF